MPPSKCIAQKCLKPAVKVAVAVVVAGEVTKKDENHPKNLKHSIMKCKE